MPAATPNTELLPPELAAPAALYPTKVLPAPELPAPAPLPTNKLDDPEAESTRSVADVVLRRRDIARYREIPSHPELHTAGRGCPDADPSGDVLDDHGITQLFEAR